MQRIALMGGSFNPIHCGHVHLARAALISGMVDSVLFLPTGNPPHKREGLADKLHRLEMTRLAIEGEAGMAVCREEVDREGVIYTVDTLIRLRESMPDTRFFYLIGADTLRVLGTWRRVDEVIALCAFLVVMRPGEDGGQALRQAAHWRSRGAQISFLPAEPMDISSTQIRARIAEGLPLDELVPPAVERYIRANGLYRAQEEKTP